MKAKTKRIFGAILTVSALASCERQYDVYGPGPDFDATDDYREQIAKESSILSVPSVEEDIYKEIK